MIRLPLNKIVFNQRIQRTMMTMEQELERPPTPDELAEALHIGPEEVMASLKKNSRHTSLDSPMTEDGEGTLLDIVKNLDAPDTDVELNHSESLRTEISRSMRVLTDRQKETLCYYFGIGMDHPMNLEDIGVKFNLTTERVRQIKDKAINKLRTNRGLKLLQGFLG